MNSNKKLRIAVVVVAIIAVGGWFTPVQDAASGLLGGVTNYDTVKATGLAIGPGCSDFYSNCTGTTQTAQFSGTGSLIGTNGIAATSTSNFDIAVTGVIAGDQVIAQLPTTAPTASGKGPFVIVAASASTTANFITLTVLNLSGIATTAISTTLQTGVNYWVVRD